MTLVQSYFIGIAMGIVASGVAFLAWYWLEDVKLRLEQGTAAWSRGFDQAWKIAYDKGLKHGEDSANSRWKDDLRSGLRGDNNGLYRH